MNKNELAAHLTALRIARLAESQGNSAQEAQTIAENTIRQGGISGAKAMATPEGSIVTIVESHLQYVAKRCVELGGSAHFTQANNEAIAAIEAHRSSFGATGQATYPKDLDDYVYYRINLEVQEQFGCHADSMGLDRQTTKILAHTAKDNLLKMMMGKSSDSGSKSCFVATACFGSPDTDTVVTLRRYRESVLKQSKAGRFSIYWYYKLSPPVANFLVNHSPAKEIVRRALVIVAKKLSKKYRL